MYLILTTYLPHLKTNPPYPLQVSAVRLENNYAPIQRGLAVSDTTASFAIHAYIVASLVEPGDMALLPEFLRGGGE